MKRNSRVLIPLLLGVVVVAILLIPKTSPRTEARSVVTKGQEANQPAETAAKELAPDQSDFAAAYNRFMDEHEAAGLVFHISNVTTMTAFEAAKREYERLHPGQEIPRAFMADSPLHVARLPAAMAKRYAPFFQKAGLSPELQDAVIAAISARELAIETSDAKNPHFTTVSLTPLPVIAKDGTVVISRSALYVSLNPSMDLATGAPYDAQIKALLTDEQFNDYVNYRDSFPLRQIVGIAQMQFLDLNMPLAPEQTDQLVALMFADNPSVDRSKNPLSDAVLAKSRDFLSQGQAELLSVLSKVTAADADLIGKGIAAAK